MNKLQEKFDRKTKELVYHVQVHQKLSKRYENFIHVYEHEQLKLHYSTLDGEMRQNL